MAARRQGRRHVARVRHRTLAGEVPAHVERGAPADRRLAGEEGQVGRARGGVVQRDDAVGQVVAGQLRAQRFAPGIAGRADESELDRALQQQVGGGQARGERARLPRDGLAPGPERLHRPLAQVAAIEVVGQAGQRVRGDGIGGGGGAVVAFAVADDQGLVAASGGVEAAVLRREVREDLPGQPLRLAQVARVSTRFVEVQEPGREVRVVLEVGVEVRLARAEGPQQPPVRGHEMRAQEAGRARGRVQVARLAGHAEPARRRRRSSARSRP